MHFRTFQIIYNLEEQSDSTDSSISDFSEMPLAFIGTGLVMVLIFVSIGVIVTALIAAYVLHQKNPKDKLMKELKDLTKKHGKGDGRGDRNVD